MKSFLTLALALVLGAVATPSLAAPVALVLEFEGTSEPEIEPFIELESNSRYLLTEGTRLVFQHYGTCDTVTVVGGRISFTEQRFLVRRGKVVDVKRERCPVATTLGKDARLGGVLMRGKPGGGLKLGPRPRLVFTGAKRAEYERLRILKDGAIVLEAPLEGGRFDWPETAAPLAPGRGYVLEVVPADGSKAPSREFEVKGRGKAPLTVFRLN